MMPQVARRQELHLLTGRLVIQSIHPMAGTSRAAGNPFPTESVAGRLDSWKEIAAYLRRDIRTVQRWEASEGMPVHRHVHSHRSSVFAFPSELDRWWASRGSELAGASDRPSEAAGQGLKWRKSRVILALAGLAAGAWVAARWQPSPGQLTTRPLTSAAGIETYPDFSPDAGFALLGLSWRRRPMRRSWQWQPGGYK